MYRFFDGTTQAAVDLSMMDFLADSINAFTSELIDSDSLDIFTAKKGSLEFDSPEHIVLYQFAGLIYDTISVPDVQTATNDVLISVENTVITNFSDNFFANTDAHGLAIYFPKKHSLFDTDYNSATINFLEYTEWDDFLEWYYTSNINAGVPVNLVYPADSPETFSWKTDSECRYKLEFSFSSEFPGNAVLSISGSKWMPCTTTDDIQESVWEHKWGIIKKIEQKYGIVYWRVIGKGRPPAGVEINEIRSFTLN